ncbi:MAG: MCE family protein, partial [Rhodococcus sp. (in: high G+C Gram-positive bacteria)]|uniref:MCE family protein n=1 Tax=Rhodococcus sp. TaxID=1831 RepID=UPI003BAFB80A
MTAPRRSTTKRVGLIGIVLTVGVVLAALNIERLPYLSNTTSYAGYFGDTGGLRPGDKVMIAGVRVGEVADVALEGDKVRIEFTASGTPLGSRTELAIKTRTVLGNKFLMVTPRGEEKLRPDQVIPIEQTETPYLLTDALGDLTTTISGLDTNQMSEALNTMSSSLDQLEPNLSAALDGVSRLSDTVSTRDQMVLDLLHNAESLTSVLSERSNQINSLLLDSNVLFRAVEQRSEAIDVLLGHLAAVSAQVVGLIDDNEAQLRPVLDDLNRTTAILREHKQDIQDTLLPLSHYAGGLGESVASGPFFKVYVMNLLPGQFLQPFIDAAFKEEGVDPGTLNGQVTYPVTCGDNASPGSIP